MWRKLMWIVGGLGVLAFVIAQRERHRVRREAELWAEATDPLSAH